MKSERSRQGFFEGSRPGPTDPWFCQATILLDNPLTTLGNVRAERRARRSSRGVSVAAAITFGSLDVSGNSDHMPVPSNYMDLTPMAQKISIPTIPAFRHNAPVVLFITSRNL